MAIEHGALTMKKMRHGRKMRHDPIYFPLQNFREYF
jgi:hypothetical protein